MLIECLRGIERVLLRIQTLPLQAALTCKLSQLRSMLTHLQAMLKDPLHCHLGGFGCSLVCFGRSCRLVYLGLLQRSQDHISYLQQHPSVDFNRCCPFRTHHEYGSSYGCGELVTTAKTVAQTFAISPLGEDADVVHSKGTCTSTARGAQLTGCQSAHTSTTLWRLPHNSRILWVWLTCVGIWRLKVSCASPTPPSFCKHSTSFASGRGPAGLPSSGRPLCRFSLHTRSL